MNEEKRELTPNFEPEQFLAAFKETISKVIIELRRTRITLTLITGITQLNTPPPKFKEIDDVFKNSAGELEKMKLLNHQLLTSWVKLGVAFEGLKIK